MNITQLLRLYLEEGFTVYGGKRDKASRSLSAWRIVCSIMLGMVGPSAASRDVERAIIMLTAKDNRTTRSPASRWGRTTTSSALRRQGAHRAHPRRHAAVSTDTQRRRAGSCSTGSSSTWTRSTHRRRKKIDAAREMGFYTTSPRLPTACTRVAPRRGLGCYFGDSRTVDVHIKRLREKLENVSEKWSLKTVWGVGYKFELKDA